MKGQILIVLLLSSTVLGLKISPAKSKLPQRGGVDEVIYRPPAVPIVDFGPHHQKFIDSDEAVSQANYWDSTNPMPTTVFLRCESQQGPILYPLVGNANIFNGSSTKVSLLQQNGFAKVRATTTRYDYTPLDQNPFFSKVSAEFLTPRIIQDPHLLSWPVTYVHVSIDHIQKNSSAPNCRLYVESGGTNVVHVKQVEEVVFDGNDKGTHHKHVKMGTSSQNVFGSCGDDFMIDWGHQFLSVHGDKRDGEYNELAAGNVVDIRSYFAANGKASPISKDSIASTNGGIAAVVGSRNPTKTADASAFHVALSYDETYAQYYFGSNIIPRWKCAIEGQEEKCFPSMHELLEEALRDWDIIRTICKQFDKTLDMNVRDRGFGDHYLKVIHTAYRQTIAANNMGYAPDYPSSSTGSKYWIFQKEISSDGDVNTMDVIFPSSPLYLHYNTDLLRDMLVPVLRYALNETWSKYTEPYSPHQLGTYPVANITMSQQEVMPLENTGNMLLMLYGILKAKNFNVSEASFFYPSAWGLLTTWADAMIDNQLPFPPFQTCTDDFAGPSANNTNLAAKGIISLYAFSKMCETLNPTKAGRTCDFYKSKARSFAQTFLDVAISFDSSVGFSHSKLAYNSDPATWSTKYNLLWQKLLGLDGPFTAEEYQEIRTNEYKLYILKAKQNQFGFPLDNRFTFQKLDWMTWAFCLDDNVENFANNFANYAFKMANETTYRYPLTDLFDIQTAQPDFLFRSRPVVGALFAPFLLFGK